MSLPQRYLKIVAELATSGALGAVVLLGATPPAVANTEPAAAQPNAAAREPVGERLAAIRAAVSAAARSETTSDMGVPDRLRLAWGNWHNGGWGGGWGVGIGGPWGNFGFGLPWNNWNNWRNGWHNWRNFWHNW